jgi:ABC-2 type transport system ATP-binding protein
MIKVSHLTKKYGELTAADDLSFEVQAGEVLGLIGPNGAGKTTTLRCMVGIIHATEGSTHIAGNDIRLDPIAAKREVAFVPDDPQFFDHLTVEEHLHFMARMYNVEDADERREALLRRLEILEKRGDLPDQLSRGMRQKLAIACALIHRPNAMLFDEPLSGLDPSARRRMQDTILAEANRGGAVIISSHQLQLVEELCGRVLLMDKGRIQYIGSIEKIGEQHPELKGGGLEEAFMALTDQEEKEGSYLPEAQGEEKVNP